MTDFVALISKDAFEKLAGKDPKPATWLKLDRYDSKHAALEGLATKGNRLFLLTVRGDAPWLVKVLMLCKREPALMAEAPEKPVATAPGEEPPKPDPNALPARDEVRNEIFNRKVGQAADAYLAELRANAVIRRP